MKIYNFEQGTEEWHQVRLGKITGSKMHTLKGNSATRTTLLYEIASERTTGKQSDKARWSNKHMERGVLLEPEARLVYKIQTGNEVEQVGFVELNEITGCSPDGLIDDIGMIEIKCKDNHGFLKNICKKEKGIEPQYMTQMQFNMYVCHRGWCDYVLYNVNYEKPLHIIRIKRDDAKIVEIKTDIERANIEIENIINEYKSRI